jgi:hypothetical protein
MTHIYAPKHFVLDSNPIWCVDKESNNQFPHCECSTANIVQPNTRFPYTTRTSKLTLAPRMSLDWKAAFRGRVHSSYLLSLCLGILKGRNFNSFNKHNDSNYRF